MRKAYDYHNNILEVGDKVTNNDNIVGVVTKISDNFGECVTVYFEDYLEENLYSFKGVSLAYGKGNILAGFDSIKKIN